MAPDNVQNSNNKNYFRLVKLLMTEGTKAVQSAVQQNLPPNTTLLQVIETKKDKIKKLKCTGFINNTQFKALYPPKGRHVNTDLFDINTWVILARNVTTSTLADKEWNISRLEDMDEDKDRWEHDITRVRLVRNRLFHMTAPDMDDIEFRWLWHECSTALQRLDESIDVERYLQLDVVNVDELTRYKLQLQAESQQDVIYMMNGDLRHRHRLVLALVALVVVLVLVLAVAIPVTWLLSRPDSCDHHKETVRVGAAGQLTFIDRSAWGASEPRVTLPDLTVPVRYIILGHTAFSDVCASINGCCDEVRSMQTVQINLDNLSDITYHFMIDGNGIVYRGRNQFKRTNILNTTNWNEHILFISILGNFMYQDPQPIALNSLSNLLEYLTQPDINLLRSDYTMYPLCQIKYSLSPGRKLFDYMQKNRATDFQHWRHNATYGWCSLYNSSTELYNGLQLASSSFQ